MTVELDTAELRSLGDEFNQRGGDRQVAVTPTTPGPDNQPSSGAVSELAATIDHFTRVAAGAPTDPATDTGCTSVGPASTVPTAAPYQFRRQPEPCLTGNPDTVLPTGNSITFVVDQAALFTCAAIQDDAVACIDSIKNGFVLQPNRSWTF